MLQSALLPSSLFQDVITDLAYDYYGVRLAVGSADHKVRIFTLNEATSDWELEEEWKAHDAPITKLCWSHPAYGPILATASFDRTIKIWEDLPSRAAHGRTRWTERAVLTDSLSSVRSVDFAPEPLGLKLASVGSDGWVRIYECQDLPAVGSWGLREELDVGAGHGESPQGVGTPGSDVPLSVGQPALSVGGLQQPGGMGIARERLQRGIGEKEAEGAWGVCWCMERWWGEVLAVVCGSLGVVKILQFLPGQSQRPVTLCLLTPPSLPVEPPLLTSLAPHPPPSQHHRDRSLRSSSPNPHPSTDPDPLASSAPAPVQTPLTSVAWAPACGRSFHLVAAGSKTGEVFLWRIVPKSRMGAEEEGSWSVELVGEFREHGGRPVGRVQFNPTGTILSSAGDDGRIRLWKASFTGVWRPMGSIYATPGEDDGMNDEDDMLEDEDEYEGYES